MKAALLTHSAALLLLLAPCAVSARASGRTGERFLFPAIRFDTDQYGVSLGWSKGWKAAPGPALSSARVLGAQSLYLHRPDIGAGMHVSVRELSFGDWDGARSLLEPEKEWQVRPGQRALRYRVKGNPTDDRYMKTCLLPIKGARCFIRVDIECARRDVSKCIGEMNRILDSLALFKRTPRFV